MNREILFRAKRKDNGEWVEGFLFKQQLESDVWCIGVNAISANDFSEIYGRNVDWFIIDPYTLCQYTGLTDKNGKKIWENDIVRYTFDYPSETATENGLKERISSVFWSEWRGSWSVYADERKGKGMNNDLFKYARNGNTVEIIGNIFDNPELLEVE